MMKGLPSLALQSAPGSSARRRGRHECPGQGDRVLPADRTEGQHARCPSWSELVERVTERGKSGRSSSRAVTMASTRQREPPADEGKQAKTHLIGPMHVLEDQQDRLHARHALEQLGDGLEELGWDRGRKARRSAAISGRAGPVRSARPARASQGSPLVGQPAERSASIHGPKGSTCSLSWHRPTRRARPSALASDASSAARRLLPMPASPTMATSWPRPAHAALVPPATATTRPRAPPGATRRAEQQSEAGDSAARASRSRLAVVRPRPGASRFAEESRDRASSSRLPARRAARAGARSRRAGTAGARSRDGRAPRTAASTSGAPTPVAGRGPRAAMPSGRRPRAPPRRAAGRAASRALRRQLAQSKPLDDQPFLE